MNWVVIEKLELDKENEKGSILSFSSDDRTDFMLIKKKAWTVAWKHYHTWVEKNKNPEITLVVSGKFELYCRDLDTQEEISFIIDENTKISIYPNVYHEIRAITNIVLLEYVWFHQALNDTIKLDNTQK